MALLLIAMYLCTRGPRATAINLFRVHRHISSTCRVFVFHFGLLPLDVPQDVWIVVLNCYNFVKMCDQPYILHSWNGLLMYDTNKHFEHDFVFQQVLLLRVESILITIITSGIGQAANSKRNVIYFELLKYNACIVSTCFYNETFLEMSHDCRHELWIQTRGTRIIF